MGAVQSRAEVAAQHALIDRPDLLLLTSQLLVAHLLDQLPLVETACRCPVHLVDLDCGRLHHTDLRLELRFKLLRVMRFFW